MQWMGLNEVREKFLSFFEEKGHYRLKSFPLVPLNDKSLLLINSGMAPMKKFFTGEEVPPSKRVTTCQKCIRTPDIENVGKTSRHGTFFEMLGNFSFGDYFKNEVTAWAWEFCTKVMELPVDKLYVSVYQDDDESYDIWTKKVGVSSDHMVRLGKEDNFWEIGSGPCGPCSEIYFDRGEKYGCKNPNCAPGCDCDRFVEFWNLVFSQFENDGNGNYSDLKQKNIDTGMGLERLACIVQGVDNLFEVDTVQNIIKHICKIAEVNYHDDEKKDISIRVITDHIRGSVFMICDGVLTSNEGRGYVLRRLIRRAARHGKLLGIKESFLYKLAETVINENKNAYPELVEKKALIQKVIKIEEENFSKTIDQGLSILDSFISSLEKEGKKTLSGAEAFKLYDTFGFPVDVTADILAEKNMDVDLNEFSILMDEQKERARNARNEMGDLGWVDTGEIDLSSFPKTIFTGYNSSWEETKILALLKDGKFVEEISDNEKAVIITEKTPFYAESGGQIGDSGEISCDNGKFIVTDTKKTKDNKYMHIGYLEDGILNSSDEVTLKIDFSRRKAIMRNHSAAHLLQAALRKVLGSHVEQSGSYVDENRVRFDFTHFSAMTKEELQKVEDLVNEEILDDIKVEKKEMPIEEAKKLGAMALFGEKYGDIVRVVKMGDFSVEFCGGTHVDNTGKLGLFKIISENSVASGVRRIEGTTGMGVLKLLDDANNTISSVALNMKLKNTGEIISKSESLINDLKEKDKKIEILNSKLAATKIDGLFDKAVEFNGVKLITAGFSGTTPDVIRNMGDMIKDKAEDVIAVLTCALKDKVTIYCVCGKEAVRKGANAGIIVREVAKVTGGGGGGKPDSAMAGAKDLTKMDEALMKLPEILGTLIK